jgi:hypothetical protein
VPFPEGFRNKPSNQRKFVGAVEAKTAANSHVIISMTYEEATYVSQKVIVDQDTDDRAKSDYKDQIRQSTILKTEWLFMCQSWMKFTYSEIENQIRASPYSVESASISDQCGSRHRQTIEDIFGFGQDRS